MKKTLTFCALIFAFCIFLTACGKGACEHVYDGACDSICNECGEVREGGAHDFAAADCDTPKTCKTCGMTEGEALGHKPAEDDGDCATAVTCGVCGATTTPAKENHTGGTATCTEKAVCEVCGTAYGSIDVDNHIDENSDHVCDYGCGVTLNNHEGGIATCKVQAVCKVCEVSYGDLDPDNHEYEKNNGICCDTYQPAELNESGYYEISNAGQLFWFANYINTVDRTASAVLVADIDLENRPWTPIGSTGENSNNFRGVFDGRDHTIKGLYVEGTKNGVGFFGEVRTGTVKNFTIYGEVVVNTEVAYVGGVIGSICGLNGENDLERNGAIIQNITSYVNLTAKAHGIGMIGGFVGYANHQSLIENCSWYGTFDAGIYRVDSGAGGFIGKIQENTSEVTIRNCAAYGTIKTNYAKNSYNNTPTIYMGGFLSFSNTKAQTTLENCLFAGKFERGENLTDQAFLGAFGTLRSVKAIKNCYYLGDDGLEAVHSDSPLKPESDNVEITKVTVEDLEGGTIATQLGEFWVQGVHYPILKDTEWHSSGLTYTCTDNGDGTHKKTCTKCGYVEADNEKHTFDADNTCICGVAKLTVEQASMTDIGSPFYGWHNETDLRAIGIQNVGKTAWDDGDQIIVTFTSPSFGTQYGTLNYDGNVGSWSTDVSFSYLESETPTVSAIYAPCYEVVDGNMQLKDGMQLGMTEYISAACSITDGTLNISFEGVTRNYSRLRISTLPGQILTVNTTDFTPAGVSAVANDVYTLTADENGNADLYGTFTVGATIFVTSGETELSHHTFTELTANGTSYALDALSAQS